MYYMQLLVVVSTKINTTTAIRKEGWAGCCCLPVVPLGTWYFITIIYYGFINYLVQSVYYHAIYNFPI